MIAPLWRTATLVVVVAFITKASTYETVLDSEPAQYIIDNKPSNLFPYITDEEYIRQIYAMYNAHKNEKEERLVIETNALVNTKYRTWKRNADLINSLLGLPKGMNDAGR